MHDGHKLFLIGAPQVDPEHADLSKMRDAAKGKLEEQNRVKEKMNVSPQELMERQQELNRLHQQVGINAQ